MLNPFRPLLCMLLASFPLFAAPETGHAISDCLYAGVNFSDGAVSCQAGRQFRCSNGTWHNLELECASPAPPPTVLNPADCACTEEEVKNCHQLGQSCCVSLENGRCTRNCCPSQ